MKKNSWLRAFAMIFTLTTSLCLGGRADAQLIYLSQNLWNGGPVPVVNKMTADGTVTTPTFATNFTNTVRGIAFNSSGTLYVLDGNTVKTVSSTGAVSNFFTIAPDENPVVANDIALDSAGNVYVTMGSVYEGGTTYYVEKIAADGSSGAQLGTNLDNGASFLAVDGSGNIYVSNGIYATTPEIYKITSDGTVSDYVTGLSGIGDLAINGAGDLFGLQSGGIAQITGPDTLSPFGPSLNYPGLLTYDSGTGDLFVEAANGSFQNIIEEIAPDGTATVIPGHVDYALGLAVGPDGTAAVPEPSSWALGCLAVLTLIWARMRIRKTA